MDMPTEQSTGLIPRSRFYSDELPAADRFDAWSESVSRLARPYLAPGVDPKECSFTMDAFLLGETFFTTSTIAGVGGYHRAGSSPMHDVPDLLVIEYFLRGGASGQNGAQTWKISEGDLVVLDPTRGFNLATDIRVSALTWALPRRMLQEALGKGSKLHPCVISGASGAGQILGNAMRMAWNGLPQQSHAEAGSVAGLLIGALAGVIRGAGQGCEEPAVDLATLDTICAYIERNIADPELGPDHLCKKFHCSRARLYRLFDPLGGVANYIRSMRLERCHTTLHAANRKTKVSEVALQWGFGSISHFNRLFRETYGVAPKDVRGAAMESGTTVIHRRTARIDAPEYQGWLARF